MLIQCEKCQTRYNLDEAKIPGKGAKVTCPTCKNVFVVMKDGSQPHAAGATPAGPAPAPAQGSSPKSLLDSFFDDGKTVAGMFPGQAAAPIGSVPMGAPPAPGRGLRSWKVRVASGLVYDFTDPATLRTWIAEKKVTTADGISEDGARWTTIGSLANLDAFFGAGPASPGPVSGFGAPGVPPVTGFGAPPTAATPPPFIPPPAAGGASLGDLFGAPPPAADPFGAAPGPGASNPFGANPFGGGGTGASANPFGDPFAAAPLPPPSSTSPFSSLPPPPPPPQGSANPFAPPPPSPFPAGDPFGAGGAAMRPGLDPFGSAGGPPSIAPPPFAAMGGTARPAPPPWASGAASPNVPAPPVFGGSAAPPSAAVSAPGFTPAAERAPLPPSPPPGFPDEPREPREPRRIGRTVAIGAAATAVVALAVAIFLQKDVIWTALRPPPLPTATATPPPAVATLDGEARTHFLAGRRYLRLDDAASYAKAEQSFRAALAAAPANPRAAAGVLESLALRRAAGDAVEEATLNGALGAASSALKEDSRGVETNRALAHYYATAGKPEQALGYLETALLSRPEDAESLFLRSTLRTADPAGAKEDLAIAAREPDYTKAHRALVASLGVGTAERTSAEAALLAIERANPKVREALDAGSYAFDPSEVERLMPGEPIPTPVVVASVEAPTPTPLAEASIASATPAPTQTSVAVATKTAAAATPTAGAVATPTVAATATPRTTSVAISTPVRATPTPVAARTVAPATPAPTPTSDSQIATAGAEDYYVAGTAYLDAGSLPDAVESFRAAVEASPKKTKYQVALGAALLRSGKKQEAADVLTRVREMEPKNAEAHKLLGMLFESTGQSAEACAEFTDYLRLAPTARDAADIRARMIRNGC